MQTPSISPKLSTKITQIALLALAALAPILIVPFTDSFTTDTKFLLIFLTGIVVLFSYALKVFTQKTITVTLSPFTTGLLAFGATTLASTLFNQQYPIQTLLSYGGVYFMTALIVGLASCTLDDQAKPATLTTVLGISGAVLGISSALQLLGVGPSMWFNSIFNTQLPQTALFSLAESPLVAAQLMGSILLGVIAALFQAQTKRKPLLMIAAAGLVIGIATAVWPILPGKETQLILPPFGITWSVAVDTLKTPQTALIGVGPNSFRAAYTLFKPVAINTTNLGGIEFNQGANLPLTLLVTMGLFGFLSWLFLIFHILKRIYTDSELRSHPTSWMLVGLIISQLLFPPHVVTLSLFAVIFTYWLGVQYSQFEHIKLYTLMTRLRQHQENTTQYTHVFSQTLAVLLAIVSLLGLYGLGRAEAAAWMMHQSTLAANNNQAVEVYQKQQEAIRLNPYIDSYRRRYGITNLTIATALANKADISEQEQQQVVQLVQQAIREGRAATTIQPTYYGNWQTLGQIYSNLTGVATGAEEWAINSYVRAAELAPANPEIRLQLGSVFYQQEQYQEAAQVFQQATALQPDYANGYYNLANALQQLGQYAQAEQAYLVLLELLEPGSEDYQLAQQELNAVRDQMATADTTEEAPTSVEQPSVIEQGLNGNQNPLSPNQDQPLPTDIQDQFNQGTESGQNN